MTSSSPRVGIIGAGAMGTLFGYYLASRCEVTMMDRSAPVLDEIARSGLAVNDAQPRTVITARSPSQLYGSSVLFLFVKAVDTLHAFRPFAGQLNPSTPVVSLQNGVGNEDAIKAALGGAVPVVLGITTESAFSLSPGRVRNAKSGSTILGSGGASPETSRWVAELLSGSGLHTSVVYDIRPHLWGKLVANAAINAVSALLDCQVGAIPGNPDAAYLSKAIAREAAQVAAGLHINLPYSDPWSYITEIISIGAADKSSMAFDLESGHRSEIDHINGAIIAAGRRLGLPTPHNEAVVRLVKAKESLRTSAVPA